MVEIQEEEKGIKLDGWMKSNLRGKTVSIH